MKRLCHVWPKVLSEQHCDSIIDRANKMDEYKAAVFDGKVVEEARRSKLKWIYPHHKQFSDVWDLVNNRFHDANAESFGVDITWNSSIQFTTYDSEEKGHYDWHRDTYWPSLNYYDRKLSMVIQLSHPETYTGGDFEMNKHDYVFDQAEIKQRGTIIVFPSFLMHRVTPVTSGIRHSLVSWISGPQWR